jgi:NaMN:DMB phosphoribosyltransferase
MKDTVLTVTLAELDNPSSQGPVCTADGLTEIVEQYDPHEELTGAAFLIIAAFGGFVCLAVATCWTIAR